MDVYQGSTYSPIHSSVFLVIFFLVHLEPYVIWGKEQKEKMKMGTKSILLLSSFNFKQVTRNWKEYNHFKWMKTEHETQSSAPWFYIFETLRNMLHQIIDLSSIDFQSFADASPMAKAKWVLSGIFAQNSTEWHWLWLNDREQTPITRRCAKWNLQRQHWEAGKDTAIFGKDCFKDRMESTYRVKPNSIRTIHALLNDAAIILYPHIKM